MLHELRRPGHSRLIAGVAGLASIAVACGTGSAGPASAPAAPASTTAPSTGDQAAAPAVVVVYLLRGGHPAPVARTVRAVGSPAMLAVTGLLQPLTRAEQGSGLTTQIPTAAGLLGVTVAGARATVDLTHGFAAAGSLASVRRRVAQVVYTLTRLPGIERVGFRIDGRTPTSIGGRVAVVPAIGRAAFEQLAAPILVESPLPGAAVASPLRVTGSANVFEATFVLEVTDWDGRVIADRTVHATSGTGTRGTFATAIRFTAPNAGPARIRLIAFERSAMDGSPTNEVEIPLRLGR